MLLPAVETIEGERKIDTVLRQLKNGVEGIQDSSQFRLFLTTMSKFHDYSVGNLILIAMQKPGATRVAGFVTWKDLGRWVKASERGIAILAPVMPPKPKKEEVEEEEKEIPLTPVYFKVVHVFDISQTEGKPLPEFVVPILTGEVNEELLAKVLALATAQGVVVSFESRPHQDPSIKGQYFGKSIWVRPEEPKAQQLKSLLHEVAHYYSEGVFRIPRRDAETIAESAAFTVGAHFGFDSGVRSFPYVALWAQDKKVLQQNLTAIRKVATVMLESLEKMQGTGEKLLPALKPFDPYKFADYVLRNNVFSDADTFVYSGLSGTNPHGVPDHIWAESLASMGGEFVKTGDLYVVHTPGVERPPDMRARSTWREVTPLMSTEPDTLSEAAEFVNKKLGLSIKPDFEIESQPTAEYVAIRFPNQEKIIAHPKFFPSDEAGRKTVLIHEISEIGYEQRGEESPHSRASEFTQRYWKEAGGKDPEAIHKELVNKDYYYGGESPLNIGRMLSGEYYPAIIPGEMNLLAATEGDPLSKFCCRQCGECAPAELLEEGKFPERIAWLRHHYKEKHPGIWGKVQPAVIPTEPLPPSPKQELEFVSDSPEFLAFTIEDIGYREKLDTAFETAIARAKGA